MKGDIEEKMNNNLTDITILLDRSGSMQTRINDVIGGFNAFLKEQKKAPGDCKLTLIQFDDVNPQEIVYNAVNIKEVPKLRHYDPRGGTPLLDALGKAIINTGSRLAGMYEEDRPGKVVFVIITDGEENMSREFNREKIKSMIERQTGVYSWDFIYLGANVDAFAEAGSMGVFLGTTSNYTTSKTAATFHVASANLATYRSTGRKEDLNFTKAQMDYLNTDDDSVDISTTTDPDPNQVKITNTTH